MRSHTKIAACGFALIAILGCCNDCAFAEDATPPQNKVSIGLSDYWLGVIVSQPSNVLHSQLNLPKGEGLVVEVVQPQSPAMTAGVQASDILLSANGKALCDAPGLMAAIAQSANNQSKEGKSEGKPAALTFDVLRGGKHLSLTATPARRPESQMVMALPGNPQSPTIGEEFSKVERWLQEVEPNMADGNRNIYFFHPGQILPKGVTIELGKDAQAMLKTTANLSDGWKIEIMRQAGGDSSKAAANQAEIVVTKGKETWKAKEGDLSPLPEKVRGEVEKLLATSSGATVRLAPVPSSTVSPNPLGGDALVWSASPADPAAENRIRAMQKQIDELTEQVKQLKEKASEKKQ